MTDQPPTGFITRLLACQRQALDSLRQSQAPPQVPQIVGQHAETQPYLVSPEAIVRQPRGVRELGYAALARGRRVSEDRPVGACCLSLGANRSDARRSASQSESFVQFSDETKTPMGSWKSTFRNAFATAETAVTCPVATSMASGEGLNLGTLKAATRLKRRSRRECGLDGDHGPDGLQHRLAHEGALAKLALTFAGLLGQDVAFHRVVALHLAASGQLEALACPSM